MMMAAAAAAPLPVVHVYKSDNSVVVKWGESGAQETEAGLSDSYTDSFQARDSERLEPFVKKFGTLLRLDGGILTIDQTLYRIQVEQPTGGNQQHTQHNQHKKMKLKQNDLPRMLQVSDLNMVSKADGSPILLENYEGIVQLTGSLHSNARDAKLLLQAAGRRVVTTGAKLLWNEFYSAWEGGVDKARVICVSGGTGTGKSCAAAILVAQINHRLSNTRVYYSRTSSTRTMDFSQDALNRQEEENKMRTPVQTVLVLDQILSEEKVEMLIALGDTVGVIVVLLSSANCETVFRKRMGRQAKMTVLPFPFSATFEEFLLFKELIAEDDADHRAAASIDARAVTGGGGGVLPGLDHPSASAHVDSLLDGDAANYQHGTAASFDAAADSVGALPGVGTPLAAGPPDPPGADTQPSGFPDQGMVETMMRRVGKEMWRPEDDLLEGEGLKTWFLFTNGHPYALALWLKDPNSKTIFQELLETCESILSAKVHLTFKVLGMLREKSLSIAFSGSGNDLRFFDPKGRVLSPLYLYILTETTALMNCPEDYYSPGNSRELEMMNVSEAAWGVERACLQDEKLLKTAVAVLKQIAPVVNLDALQSRFRIPYQDDKSLADYIDQKYTEMSDQGVTGWAIHAIPLRWNQPHIDCTQIYFSNNDCYIVGNSVSVSDNASHQKSLRWLPEARTNFLLHATLGVRVRKVILLFTGNQMKSASSLTVDRSVVGSYINDSFAIMDQDVVQYMGNGNMLHYWKKAGMEKSNLGVRRLTLATTNGCDCASGETTPQQCTRCNCSKEGAFGCDETCCCDPALCQSGRPGRSSRRRPRKVKYPKRKRNSTCN